MNRGLMKNIAFQNAKNAGAQNAKNAGAQNAKNADIQNVNNIAIQQMKVNGKPSIKVTIQLELEFSLPGKTIEEVEGAFREVFQSAACKSLGKYLEARDSAIVFEESGTDEREIRHTYHNRHLKLSYGNVYFNYRQIKKGGGHCSPLLLELGIKDKQRVVKSSYEDAFCACAKTTFRKARVGIANPLSLGGLHEGFQEIVGQERKDEMSALEYLKDVGYSPPSPPSDVARVMDDGIFIRERVLPGRGKGQKQEKRHHMEVQLTRCDFAAGGEKYWSYPPFVYASIEPAGEHISHGRTYLDVHTGLSLCGAVIHISDAKANGNRHCKEYNPNAVWLLDWYHLGRHVGVLSRVSRKLRDEVWGFLSVERFDEAVSLLNKTLSDMENLRSPDYSCDNIFLSDLGKKSLDWLGNRKKDLTDLIGYLENNRDGIYGYLKLVGKIPVEHMPFGSGQIERACGFLIAHRMKGHGKAWKREGGGNMVCLLTKLYRGTVKSETLESAKEESKWWEELQSKPLPSAGGTKTTEGRKSKKGAVYAKSASIYPATVSLPILKGGKKGEPEYCKLKYHQTSHLVGI